MTMTGDGGRIEHDYRELKHGLGLDHFEGRTWNRGRHHHVTRVTAAQAFLTLRRLDQSPDAGLSLHQVLDVLQTEETGSTSGDSTAARDVAAVIRRLWCRRQSTS